MGRGRRKAMAKKMVREVKYFSPKVDYTGLAEEIGTADERVQDVSMQGKGVQDPDAHLEAKTAEGCPLSAMPNDAERPLHEMNEDELQEYLEWSKNAASKPHDSKLEHVK